MPPFVIAYAASAVTLLILDVIWLTLAAPRIYQPLLGDLLAPQPNLVVAGIFYLLYLVGVTVFVTLPGVQSQSWLQVLGLGLLLGLVAYGTYDFTNLATLRGWPVSLTVIDLCWGMFLTATAALAGYFAVRTFGA